MPAAKKRTASPAQLRALAKGRAKLKAARRQNKTTRKSNPKDCRFSFKPQADLGIKSNSANVYCGRKLIGYIELKNVPAMKKGNFSGFKPVSNWRNTFSVRLKERLSLRTTRAKNPAPIPRGIMRKRALGSNLKAGTAKTKARGRMTNPSYFVIKSSTSSRYFDGAGWTVRKQYAAHYKMAKLAGLIGQKVADATGKSVSVVPA